MFEEHLSITTWLEFLLAPKLHVERALMINALFMTFGERFQADLFLKAEHK